MKWRTGEKKERKAKGLNYELFFKMILARKWSAICKNYLGESVHVI